LASDEQQITDQGARRIVVSIDPTLSGNLACTSPDPDRDRWNPEPSHGSSHGSGTASAHILECLDWIRRLGGHWDSGGWLHILEWVGARTVCEQEDRDTYVRTPQGRRRQRRDRGERLLTTARRNW
jgi:hypothetical protein